MKRYFLVGCGACLIAIPCLWVVYQLVVYGLVYWYEGFYPSRFGIGLFFMTLIVGIVMVIARLDIVGTWHGQSPGSH